MYIFHYYFVNRCNFFFYSYSYEPFPALSCFVCVKTLHVGGVFNLLMTTPKVSRKHTMPVILNVLYLKTSEQLQMFKVYMSAVLVHGDDVWFALQWLT